MTHAHRRLVLCGPAKPAGPDTLVLDVGFDVDGEVVGPFPTISQPAFAVGGRWHASGGADGGGWIDSTGTGWNLTGSIAKFPTLGASLMRVSVWGRPGDSFAPHDWSHQILFYSGAYDGTAGAWTLVGTHDIDAVSPGASTWVQVVEDVPIPAGATAWGYRSNSGAGPHCDELYVVIPGSPGRDVLNGTSALVSRCDHIHLWIADRIPSAADDTTLGFRVGTLWLNTVNNTLWVLTDAAEGAAVWVQASIGLDHVGDVDAHLQANYGATTDPTVDDDAVEGYSVGSMWVNTTTGDAFIAVDVTTGAAAWVQLNGGTGSLSDATPLVESGTGSAGTSTDASRSDHVHPTDGGGGGGAAAVWSPILDTKGTTDTPDDEFASSTLDAKWTAVDGSAAAVALFELGEVERYDLTTRSGWLLMQAGSGAGQRVMLRQDYTLPDGKSIVVALAPSVTSDADSQAGIANNEQWAGVCINDDDSDWNAGEYSAVMFDVDANGARILGWDGVVKGHSGGLVSAVGVIYLRLSRVGSIIYFSWSRDGATWMHIGQDTRAGVASNVWLFTEATVSGGEPVPVQAFDWIRLGTNGVDPW